MGSDFSIGTGDSQLREDLADAMRESPGGYSRETGEFILKVNFYSKKILLSIIFYYLSCFANFFSIILKLKCISVGLDFLHKLITVFFKLPNDV